MTCSLESISEPLSAGCLPKDLPFVGLAKDDLISSVDSYRNWTMTTVMLLPVCQERDSDLSSAVMREKLVLLVCLIVCLSVCLSVFVSLQCSAQRFQSGGWVSTALRGVVYSYFRYPGKEVEQTPG